MYFSWELLRKIKMKHLSIVNNYLSWARSRTYMPYISHTFQKIFWFCRKNIKTKKMSTLFRRLCRLIKKLHSCLEWTIVFLIGQLFLIEHFSASLYIQLSILIWSSIWSTPCLRSVLGCVLFCFHKHRHCLFSSSPQVESCSSLVRQQ